jgi:hypothetical protein
MGIAPIVELCARARCVIDAASPRMSPQAMRESALASTDGMITINPGSRESGRYPGTEAPERIGG